MTVEQPTKIKEQVALRFTDDLTIEGDLYSTTYVDGDMTAIILLHEEGEEIVSVNLIAYGLLPEIGAVFVKNDFPHLAQSLADVTGGTVKRTVSYGPCNSTATEVTLGA